MIDKSLAIQTVDLSKRFNGFDALKKLNIEVEPNTVYGFLGHNGSGKTTTLRLLTGLSSPTAGHAYVFGYDCAEQDIEFRRIIGYLPDVPSFFGFMNGLQYLTYCGELFGLDHGSSMKKAHELIELTGLKEAALRKANKYSRGMKQRLGMAAALVGDPRVVFLDEPISALDPVGRVDILSIIERLKERATVFLSTHIINDVERVCDKVGIIDHGKLVVSQSVKSLKKESTKQGFEVKLVEDPTEILPEIQGREWCDEASCIVGEDGAFKLTAYVSDENQARQDLSQMIAKHKYNLLSFNATQISLEDVFIKLAGGK